MDGQTQEHINEATREITRILADLERKTGMVVDSLSLYDLDITSIEDDRPQLSRSVLLEMKRLPGTRWAT